MEARSCEGRALRTGVAWFARSQGSFPSCSHTSNATVERRRAAAANLLTVLALARTHHVANVFITDRNLDNPWDRMPSYWQQEVDSIAASNETAHYGGGFRRPGGSPPGPSGLPA